MATIKFKDNKVYVNLSETVDYIDFGLGEFTNLKTKGPVTGESKSLTVEYNKTEPKLSDEYGVKTGGAFEEGATVTITAPSDNTIKAADGQGNEAIWVLID
ncbi:hypothetical protein FCOIX_1174 [Fusarium coicis]|nr:hypothetical protein FCOIX_1174 [Fusarium coicis]